MRRTDVAASELAALRETLGAAELQRADAFRKPEDQRRFIVAHAAVRHLLGEHLGRAPASLAFVIGKHGKPELADGAVHFNLSHSGDLAAIAVAPRPVGVDVEARRKIHRVTELAESRFAPGELARVMTAADPQDEFLKIWTAKEAVVKATGLGLTLDLASFEVPEFGTAPVAVRALNGGRSLAKYRVLRLEPGAGYHGAIAFRLR